MAEDTGNSVRVSVSPWEKTNKTVTDSMMLESNYLSEAGWGTSRVVHQSQCESTFGLILLVGCAGA
jgi:hypothetical protein